MPWALATSSVLTRTPWSTVASCTMALTAYSALADILMLARLVGNVVCVGNHDGEQVGQRSEDGGLPRLRGHRGVTQSGQGAGRRRRGDDRRRIAEVERAARGGVHAHVCHEAGYHEVRGVGGFQPLIKIRLHERVRIVLHHHRLAVVRGHPGYDRTA